MQKKRLFSNPNRKKLIIDNRVYTKNFTGPHTCEGASLSIQDDANSNDVIGYKLM